MNFCRSCKQDFGSLGAFDKHRVGKHAFKYSIDQPDGRRCLHHSELSDAGWKRDAHGRWRMPGGDFSWRDAA